MTVDAAVTVVQQRDIPAAIRALDALPSDYVDLFVVSTGEPVDVSPEQLARAAVEGASATGRFLAWRMVCHLRLERNPSPDYIGGWKIVDRGDNWIRVEASSWFMTANMVFHLAETQVSFATFVRYDRPVSKLVWAPASAIHRTVAPNFLGSAVRRISRGRGRGPS